MYVLEPCSNIPGMNLPMGIDFCSISELGRSSSGCDVIHIFLSPPRTLRGVVENSHFT